MSKRVYATPFSMLHAASLLSQRNRIMKFDMAIERVVKRNDYVIDIGTGTGILAILAAKRGARVTAIEINEDSLQYAQRAAGLNNMNNQIKYVRAHYSEFVPDERADVVLCEMLSSMMLIEQQIPASTYAVENFLKPSGRILPENVSIFIVPVQNEVLWNRFEVQELLFPRVPQTAEKGQSIDLADPVQIAHFDLSKSNRNTAVDSMPTFNIVNNGIVHGVVGIFESKLCEDIFLQMEDGWKELFIPLDEPVKVTEGEKMKIRISYCPGEFDSLRVEHQ